MFIHNVTLGGQLYCDISPQEGSIS